jgi:hypothetical protein
MSNERPGGDWRQPAGSKPQAPRASNASRRTWQPGGPTQASPVRPGRSRGFRLLLACGFTGLLVGLMIVVILFFWPANYPHLATLSATASESLALPENVAGANAANELASWAADGRERPQMDQSAIVTADASGVKFAIDPNAKNLVLYVTSHGGADVAGPYLWVAPPDAGSVTAAFKVRIRDLLDRIAERRGKPTLLILDATRMTASWPHGMLFNDFARALKELDGDIEHIPGLVVICASDEDQRSWVFEERRMSVFGYYFLEAMRGAGRNPGERVTVSNAFDFAKTEVERWTIGNRAEKQTPILLPSSSGRSRPEKMALSVAPGGGYQSPPASKLDAPVDVPHELEEAWKTASQLAALVPPPEANSPGQWREYLDTLVRWEHLFRLGANTNTIRDRVSALASQFKNPTLAREPACQGAAIPTALALGGQGVAGWPRGSDAYNTFKLRVWDAATPAERSEAWSAILRSQSGKETEARTAVASAVLMTLIEDMPTPNNLRIAADVLSTTHSAAGIPAPAEAHFVRMLQLRLDEKNRPDPALLKQAVALRKEAEEAAWVFMTQPTEYAYAEYVFPWVRNHIEKADRERELGQDLLFDGDSKSWQDAAGYFERAHSGYALARTDGRKVAAALAVRDKIFARLPYYARWLASYRGSRPQVQIDQLLDQAENAARKAHQIAELMAKEPSADQLEKLDALRAEVDGHFKALTDAFDADIAAFTNTTLPSNWHALDCALTVPFIPSRRRAELLGYLRFVSYQLAINTQQPEGSRVPPPATREIAARQGRMALALLNDQAPDHRQLIDHPDPHAWWKSYRTVGDQIGTQFGGLAGAVKANGDQAARTATLKEAAMPLAKAAALARLIDSAAPLLPGSDPVAVYQRFQRHEMLLWQAQRTTTEGWADVAPTTPDGWYCRKVAGLLVSSAQDLILEDAAELTGRPAGNLSPVELDRWLSDCRNEAGRRPIVLKLDADPDRTIADRLSWDFSFTVTVPDKDKGAVGFPVSWLDVPGAPYPQPKPSSITRRLEPDFVRGRTTASREIQFTSKDRKEVAAEPKKLTSTVLYRGNLYQKETVLALVGNPTHEWVYTPPKGPASFAIRAERSEVAGAVTILIDLTASMSFYHINPDDKTTPTRLEEAKKGLELVLKQLPRGTTVTLAYFYGNNDRTVATVKPYGVPVVLDGSNWERVYAAFKDEKATGESTPLAGAIREVLVKDNAKKFWPANFTTGSRTLIVLTDGEDNWAAAEGLPSVYENEPGPLVLKALRNNDNNPDDINLHIIFFGLTSKEHREEEQRALKQFEVLQRPEQFRDPPRTPVQLWSGVREAKALAELCRGAMLPQFPFSSGRQLAKRLEATVPEEGVLRTTTPLEPAVYDLWGLRGQQAIQLRPADRVLFQARRRDNAFELFLPAYAYETATKTSRPRASSGTAASGGIFGTIPELAVNSGSNDTGLSLAVTMEPNGERRAANLLEITRPKFAWFDVVDEDGKPAPYVGIQNRWPLWAPAWDLKLNRWESGGTALAKARHPVVRGYWLDGFPERDTSYPVNLNDLPGSLERLAKMRTVRVRENDVNLLGITREEYSDSSLPKGEYLTIRMKYGKPGELVFVRPGNLKDVEQPYSLYERHVYYDSQSLYTARFGPIFDSDRNKDITIDLYAVAGLREASERGSRAVKIRFPAGDLESLTMPQELTVPPRKE